MKLEKLRRGQREALNVVISRLKAGESYTTIVLPTRYGKSDVMRLVALAGEQEGCVGWALILSPLSFLRDQVIDADKVRDFTHRYHIDSSYARRCTAWCDSSLHLFADQRRLLVSATMAMATQNVQICADLVDEVKHRTGRPLVVQIDECHEVSDQKRRGELLRAMIDRGALAVLYTATPVRADGELIPGFETDPLNSRERERYELTGQIDDVTGREIVRVWTQMQSLVQLKAHHATTYREAWNEDPAPICRVTRDVIDVDVAKILTDGSVKPQKLSECDMTTARRVIARAGRHPTVIARGSAMLVDELIRRRQAHPTTAAIVFTGNDEANDPEDNRHAKAVAEAIKSVARQRDVRLGVRIITMKSEEGNTCADALRDFVNGDGDVLIVKQIGGAGLDCERIKVVLDLSSVRTVASVMQRIMRCATPWNNCKIGTVITLADPMMQAIWHEFIVKEGGDAGVWRTEQEQWARDQPRKDPKDDPTFVVNGAGLGVFDDSDGGRGSVDQWDNVAAFLDDFPAVSDRYTKPEIAERLLRFFGRVPTAPSTAASLAQFEPANRRCDRHRQDMHAVVKELLRKRAVPYSREQPGAWVDSFTDTYNELKRRCGVPLSCDVKEISDPDVMARLLSAAQTMLAEMT